MTHEENVEGAVRVERVEVDPTEPGPAPLPEVPSSGLVLAEIATDRAGAGAAHLLDFCARWSDEGHRVFLCDGCFETPALHGPAGTANGEGLSDALLYGTTLGRIATPMASGVRLATAGTVVADPDAARDHARWDTIVSGFEEAGVLLVVAVPSGAPEGRLHARARSVISLAPIDGGSVVDGGSTAPEALEDEAPDEVALGEDWADIDVVHPPDTEEEWRDRDRTEDAVVPIDGAWAEDDVVVDSSQPARAHADTGDAGAASRSAPGAGEKSTPRSAPPRPSSETRRSSPLTLVLLLVLLGLLLLGYLGVIQIPFVTPADLDIAG